MHCIQKGKVMSIEASCLSKQNILIVQYLPFLQDNNDQSLTASQFTKMSFKWPA